MKDLVFKWNCIYLVLYGVERIFSVGGGKYVTRVSQWCINKQPLNPPNSLMFLMWMQWFLVTYKLCCNMSIIIIFLALMHLLEKIITLKPFILISPVYNQCILSMIDYGTSVVNNMTITLFVDMNNYLFDKYLVKVKRTNGFVP